MDFEDDLALVIEDDEENRLVLKRDTKKHINIDEEKRVKTGSRKDSCTY